MSTKNRCERFVVVVKKCYKLLGTKLLFTRLYHTKCLLSHIKYYLTCSQFTLRHSAKDKKIRKVIQPRVSAGEVTTQYLQIFYQA